VLSAVCSVCVRDESLCQEALCGFPCVGSMWRCD